MKYSVVITTAKRDLCNQLGEALGWGANTYSVPLSLDGNEPATHWGLHTYARQVFVDMLTDAQAGIYPVVEGMTEAEVGEAVASLNISIDSTGMIPAEHFEIATGMVIVEATL